MPGHIQTGPFTRMASVLCFDSRVVTVAFLVLRADEVDGFVCVV